MDFWLAADSWRRRGFRVFPVHPGSKIPAIKNYELHATDDAAQIAEWWCGRFEGYNIGTPLGPPYVLFDGDVKGGRRGDVAFRDLGLEGLRTLTVRTPTNGFHKYFLTQERYSNQTNVLPGVDVRSAGGYALVPGSLTNGAPYTVIEDAPIVELPEVLRQALRLADAPASTEQFLPLDHPRSIDEAVRYLLERAEVSIEGYGGNDTAYRVATVLTHDYALSIETAVTLLCEHWNARCLPPWGAHELSAIVSHGATYGKGHYGAKTTVHMLQGVQLVEPPVRAEQPAKVNPILACFGNALSEHDWVATKWVVRNALLEGIVTLLVAPGKVGKSLLTLVKAAHIVMGQSLAPGWDTEKPGRVVLINLEDNLSVMSQRLKAVCIAYDLPFETVKARVAIVTDEALKFRLTRQGTLEWDEDLLATLTEALAPADIVAAFIDPLASTHYLNENDSGQMTQLIDTYVDVAKSTQTAIGLVHHTVKTAPPSGFNHGDVSCSRGSSAISNHVRHTMTLLRLKPAQLAERGLLPDDLSYVQLTVGDSNYSSRKVKPLYFHSTELKGPRGEELPVLKIHEWEEKANVDAGVLGELINEIMVERATGEVPQQDLIEKWQEHDCVRALLPKDAVADNIKSLYNANKGFRCSLPDGGEVQFKKEKVKGRIVFVAA